MSELEAFEAVTIAYTPSVTRYKGQDFHSTDVYRDALGYEWHYLGLRNGSDSMWLCNNGDTAAWNIIAVVDQRGPLTKVGA